MHPPLSCYYVALTVVSTERQSKYRWICDIRFLGRYHRRTVYLGVLHSIVGAASILALPTILIVIQVELYSAETHSSWMSVSIPRRPLCSITNEHLTSGLSFPRVYNLALTLSLCKVITLIMQLLIWFVNSNIENAFSTSIIGAVYGPIFPACLGMSSDILPSEVRMISMGLMYVLSPSRLSTFLVST